MRGHIVVTGCAGFTGSHLTERLLADGHSVGGIASFEDYYSRAIKQANVKGACAGPVRTYGEADLVDPAAVSPSSGLRHDEEGSRSSR